MEKTDLFEFLQHRMSMTDVYQPVVIKELLLHEGIRTKAELAAALAVYDLAVQEYYERIVMRWPKITLTRHGIVDYERRGSLFRLLPYPDDADSRLVAVQICDEKIADWLEKKKSRENAPEAVASVREAIADARQTSIVQCHWRMFTFGMRDRRRRYGLVATWRIRQNLVAALPR